MKLSEIIAAKQELIKDLRDGITFVPDRNRDIYRFMENYMREAQYDNRAEVKEKILGHLIDCAQGRQYPNPHEGREYYSHADVDQLDKLLDALIAAAERGDAAAFDAADETLDATILTPEHDMIDTWRREMLHNVRSACKELSGTDAPTHGADLEMEGF